MSGKITLEKDQIREFDCLSNKVKVIGEYIVTMERSEVTNDAYHNLGEKLYGAGLQLQRIAGSVER